MTTREPEIRSLAQPVEAREADGKRMAAGYAAVFNSETNIGGYFREVIAPGAFSESIAEGNVRAYFDHDTGRVLGRQSAGTLRLSEDERGLAVEIDLPNTSDGRDVTELLDRGDVDGMSFAFRVRHEEWDETVDPPLRTIHSLELREVSIVSEPQYSDTSIALRSLEAAKIERRKVHNSSGFLIRKAETEHRLRGL